MVYDIEYDKMCEVIIVSEQEMLTKAIVFAAKKHENQTRKDGSPYIYHPLKVAEIVRDAGYGIKYQVVAILHDVLEDTDATENDVREFGEDVLEAVNLLTRLPGMDEEEYVNLILQNRIAAIVKNADKIHNVWEASYSVDKDWARKYVKKAKRYYEKKFSYALDRAIGNAKGTLCIHGPKKKGIYYTPSEMMLNSDREVLVYNNCKDLYERCINHPDFNDSTMQYWYCELGRYHFCFLDDDNVWSLGRAGWLPICGNPLLESEYGDELYQESREEILDFIEKKKKECYFYDFVDLSQL